LKIWSDCYSNRPVHDTVNRIEGPANTGIYGCLSLPGQMYLFPAASG
jgi:hypothetical protein